MFEPDHAPNAAQTDRSPATPIIAVRRLNLWYGTKQALKDVSFNVFPSDILAFIGPSGCGKTTALKCLNRMHDDIRGVEITGQILMEGVNIYGPEIDPPVHRRHFGWVAQKPNPFVSSVYDNIAYGARIHGIIQGRSAMDDHVEHCLRRAELWDEVKDKRHKAMGTERSGGQQQRLCIARALSTEPDILLMDEPTGSIDPIATEHVEYLMLQLGKDHAVIVITHSMMQARRVADRVAYFHLGELKELGATEDIFTRAQTPEAQQFIAGRMG
mgnify:CR=1 FL=1